MDTLLYNVTATIASLLRRRRRRRSRPETHRNPDEEMQQWVTRWAGEERSKKGRLQRVEQEWRARWASQTQGRPPRYLGDIQAADLNPTFQDKQPLLKHKQCPKHISSMITQLRTGRVGLRAFLFQRKVPNIITPICSCGEAPETTYHVLLNCPQTRLHRDNLPIPLRTSRDTRMALDDKKLAGEVALWFLKLQKLPQFLLAQKLHPG